MPNNRTRPPLPEPAAWLEHVTISSGNRSGPTKEWRVTQNPSTSAAPRRTLHTADQMHAYSDAENADLRERVKVLEDALGEYIAAADNTITCNDKDMTTAMLRFGDADKAARAALEAK